MFGLLKGHENFLDGFNERQLESFFERSPLLRDHGLGLYQSNTPLQDLTDDEYRIKPLRHYPKGMPLNLKMDFQLAESLELLDKAQGDQHSDHVDDDEHEDVEKDKKRLAAKKDAEKGKHLLQQIKDDHLRTILRKLFVMAIGDNLKKIFYYSDYCSYFAGI